MVDSNEIENIAPRINYDNYDSCVNVSTSNTLLESNDSERELIEIIKVNMLNEQSRQKEHIIY